MKNRISDQRGKSIKLDAPPQRIVSLVPSVTETVIELGAGDRLVGRTRFCIHPEDRVEGIPTVGGTKTPDLNEIADLDPDLVLTNREENKLEHVEQLEERGFPCYVCFPRTREEGLALLDDLGRITACKQTAADRLTLAEEDLAKTEELTSGWAERSYLFFIWRNPWMVTGSDTYVSDLLSHLKLINVAPGEERYPEMTEEQIREADPDLLLLSTEPFPFGERWKEKVCDRLAGLRAVEEGEVRIVDGEWSEWYGWRTPVALSELAPSLKP